MCEPTTIMIAMAASAAYGLNQQRKAAKRSERFYRSAQAEESRQIHASKSSEANTRKAQMRRERARLRAISAESGLTGITSGTLLDNTEVQAGFDISRIGLSERFGQTNSRFQLQSNLNNIQQPDYLGTALNTGLQMASFGYDSGVLGGKPAATAPSAVPSGNSSFVH